MRTDFTEGSGVLDTSDGASADLGAGSVHCKGKEGDSGGLGTPGLILVICLLGYEEKGQQPIHRHFRICFLGSSTGLPDSCVWQKSRERSENRGVCGDRTCGGCEARGRARRSGGRHWAGAHQPRPRGPGSAKQSSQDSGHYRPEEITTTAPGSSGFWELGAQQGSETGVCCAPATFPSLLCSRPGQASCVPRSRHLPPSASWIQGSPEPQRPAQPGRGQLRDLRRPMDQCPSPHPSEAPPARPQGTRASLCKRPLGRARGPALPPVPLGSVLLHSHCL